VQPIRNSPNATWYTELGCSPQVQTAAVVIWRSWLLLRTSASGSEKWQAARACTTRGAVSGAHGRPGPARCGSQAVRGAEVRVLAEASCAGGEGGRAHLREEQEVRSCRAG
jgi:hypothetical protein